MTSFILGFSCAKYIKFQVSLHIKKVFPLSCAYKKGLVFIWVTFTDEFQTETVKWLKLNSGCYRSDNDEFKCSYFACCFLTLCFIQPHIIVFLDRRSRKWKEKRSWGMFFACSVVQTKFYIIFNVKRLGPYF